MAENIFTYDYANGIYDKIHSWLTSITFGEYRTPGSFKWYDKNLWCQLFGYLIEVSRKTNPSEVETKFLERVLYTGNVYRVHSYNNQRKFILETNSYQHWSKDIQGLKALRSCGEHVMIIASTSDDNPGINLFGLLMFLFENNYVTEIENEFKHPKTLCRYEEEQEVVMKMSIENVQDIRLVNYNDLDNWTTVGESIDRSKWIRKSLY